MRYFRLCSFNYLPSFSRCWLIIARMELSARWYLRSQLAIKYSGYPLSRCSQCSPGFNWIYSHRDRILRTAIVGRQWLSQCQSRTLPIPENLLRFGKNNSTLTNTQLSSLDQYSVQRNCNTFRCKSSLCILKLPFYWFCYEYQ